MRNGLSLARAQPLARRGASRNTPDTVFTGALGLALQKAILFFVIVISLWPMVWVFVSSFKTNSEILSSALSLPTRFSFFAYISAIEQSKFLLFFSNSLFVSFFSVVISIFIFGMSGYVLARFDFPGRRLISILFISTLLVSLIPMQQPILRVVQTLDLYDSRWALVLVSVGKGLPIVTFIMISFFRSIPRELEEAAWIDGAGFFKTYFLVVFPLMRPAMASSGVLVFLNSWNEFLFPLLLTKSEATRTLPLALRSFENMFSYNFPVLFAAIVLTISPSIIIFILLQEQIQKSMAAGAVKG